MFAAFAFTASTAARLSMNDRERAHETVRAAVLHQLEQLAEVLDQMRAAVN